MMQKVMDGGKHMKAGRYLSVLLCVMILSAAVPAAAAQPAEEMKIEAAAARGAGTAVSK